MAVGETSRTQGEGPSAPTHSAYWGGGTQDSNRRNCEGSDGLGAGAGRRRAATGAKGVPPTKVSPFWRGALEESRLAAERWAPGG